ncbi:hypothetical protein JNW90_07005 [Micromonospora sp. STR1s_5]|nr:hypothetical protein [Micromonospora sp. STR1s_5]
MPRHGEEGGGQGGPRGQGQRDRVRGADAQLAQPFAGGQNLGGEDGEGQVGLARGAQGDAVRLLPRQVHDQFPQVLR